MPQVEPSPDPLASVDRLRRPARPWLHLLDAAPSDARQLGWLLGQEGVVVRILRGHCLRTRYGLLDEAAAALQLPGDPVEDWESLAGLLTDLSWLPATGHVLVVTRAALLLAAAPLTELVGLVGAVRDIARTRAEESDPVPFHLVLQDDAVGLAVLRARLDAVGARYAELSDWDAEEPSVVGAPSARSAYSPGDGEPDEVDRAVAAALSRWHGVVEVRRYWEEFRGPAQDAVRVYAPVLDASAAPAATDIAGAISAVVAAIGQSCLVVPVPDQHALRDPGHRAITGASTVIWPPPAPAPAYREPADSTADQSRDLSVPMHEPAAPVESLVSAEPQSSNVPLPGDESWPADDPRVGFELVEANLEWTFAKGTDDLDAIDRGVVAEAGVLRGVVSLFRTWVRDPAAGWVRVIMAYVDSPSIATVERVRDRVIEALRRGGATRCCVEIVAGSDVGDVHRWLEDRSVALSGAAGRPDPDAAAASSPPIPTDASFVAEPAVDDPLSTRLVGWASARPGAIGLVTAWTEIDGRSVLVLGVLVEPEADQDTIRSEATRLVDPTTPHLVESFAPSTGMTPLHLRLYRGSTRLWTHPVERARSTVRLDTTYRAKVSRLEPVIDVTSPVRDEELPNGFTLVGLDLTTSLERGPDQPGESDTAVARWAAEQERVLAVLRAIRPGDTGAGPGLPVYSVLVDHSADRHALRGDVAGVVATTGADRCAIEVYCPFEKLSVFHVQLYGSSITLWKTAERRPAPST